MDPYSGVSNRDSQCGSTERSFGRLDLEFNEDVTLRCEFQSVASRVNREELEWVIDNTGIPALRNSLYQVHDDSG
jgi:hypothetical protein